MTDDFGGATCDAIDPFNPQDREHWIKLEHLGRYLFAGDFLGQIKAKTVADIACGTGYGIAELQRGAVEIIAVDNDSSLLTQVEAHYAGQNIRTICADLTTDALTRTLNNASLTAIVCFETLEHLLDPHHTLTQFHTLLMPDGYLLVSVPNMLYESKDRAGLPYNRNHRQFFSYRSLSTLLESTGFRVEYRMGQGLLNTLARRETQLTRWKALSHRITDFEQAHHPDFVRVLSRLLAYPSIDDTEGSYALIVIAHKAPA